MAAKDLPHVLQLSLHSAAVSTELITPGDDGSIVKNGSKCALRGLDLLHVRQLSLHSAAVSTELSITPGDDGSIVKNGSKCARRGLDLLHVLQLSLSAPNSASPQVTADPSSSMAAKAP